MTRSRRRSAPGDRDASAALPSEADRIIDAAFASIPTEGWRRLSLAAVAAASGLPILNVYRHFRSKHSILRAFMRRIDEAVLANPPSAEDGERARDRLFDLMMRRFDALGPYKAALEVLRRELPFDPPAMFITGCALLRSVQWMHEAADIATHGIRGQISVRLTSAAYLATMSVWQRDASADLGQTMAALDTRLRRIERWLTQARATVGLGPARSA